MNNNFKKFVAMLLSVLTCLSCGVTAFAEGENAPAEKVESDYTCNFYYSTDFIVVTFDSKYSRVGEEPEVRLNNGTYVYPIGEDAITLRVFENEGKRYPQLFIETKLATNDISSIKIDAGAFVTESGEVSGKVNIPRNKIHQISDFGVSCEIEAFEVEESIDLITSKTGRYATVGKPVRIVGTSEFGKVWLGETTATYTLNGETTEIISNEFVPQEPGKYVVELKFGDFVTRILEFEVLSETKSYTKSLGDATEWMLLSPLYLVLGSGMAVLIPGFGTWIGSTTVMAALAMIPRFFKVLFGGPMYKEYILE